MEIKKIGLTLVLAAVSGAHAIESSDVVKVVGGAAVGAGISALCYHHARNQEWENSIRQAHRFNGKRYDKQEKELFTKISSSSDQQASENHKEELIKHLALYFNTSDKPLYIYQHDLQKDLAQGQDLLHELAFLEKKAAVEKSLVEETKENVARLKKMDEFFKENKDLIALYQEYQHHITPFKKVYETADAVKRNNRVLGDLVSTVQEFGVAQKYMIEPFFEGITFFVEKHTALYNKLEEYKQKNRDADVLKSPLIQAIEKTVYEGSFIAQKMCESEWHKRGLKDYNKRVLQAQALHNEHKNLQVEQTREENEKKRLAIREKELEEGKRIEQELQRLVAKYTQEK